MNILKTIAILTVGLVSIESHARDCSEIKNDLRAVSNTDFSEESFDELFFKLRLNELLDQLDSPDAGREGFETLTNRDFVRRVERLIRNNETFFLNEHAASIRKLLNEFSSCEK